MINLPLSPIAPPNKTARVLLIIVKVWPNLEEGISPLTLSCYIYISVSISKIFLKNIFFNLSNQFNVNFLTFYLKTIKKYLKIILIFIYNSKNKINKYKN